MERTEGHRRISSRTSLSNLLVNLCESPAKAKTVNKMLGKGFQVKASMGHVKDLPKSKLGVDTEKDFKPHYITIRSRSKLLKELKEMARKTKRVYLATDPDREGEAIGWHLASELKGKGREIHRILFHEITKKAIKKSKDLINRAMFINPEGFSGENQGFGEVFASGEPKEKLVAFMETRKRGKSS